MKQLLRELEELVIDAWPARETHEQEGWLLRASGGPTRRGNSVATLERHSERTVDEDIELVERWYAAQRRPAAFQIGPCARPRELDQALAARGYLKASETAFAATPAAALAALAVSTGPEVRVSAKPEPAWLELVAQASRFAGELDSLLGFFKRLGSRCRFATAFEPEGAACASCFAIASEDRLGVYNMITRPDARRRGAGRALLRAMGESALGDAMREVYLMVELDNAPARALYDAAGFRDVYSYFYRIQPG